MGAFTLLTRPGPKESHDLSGEGINSGLHTYFFDHIRTRRASPDEGSAQFRSHFRDNTNMKDDSQHTIHAAIHSNKANMKEWLWRPKDIRGTCRPKASWHLSYSWGQTPKKLHPGNLSRLGSNPDPLRDRRAFYRLLQRWTDLKCNTENNAICYIEQNAIY